MESKPCAIFAASAYVGESVGQPRKYFQNNVVNSLNLFDAMLDTGVRKLVFSSSCAVYGEPQQLPLPRNTAADQPLWRIEVVRGKGSAMVRCRIFSAVHGPSVFQRLGSRSGR